MRKTNAITEGAVLLALFIVLMLVAKYAPIIGILALFVLPLPFIIFTIRHSLSTALMLVVAGSILSVLFGSITNILLALMFGLSGMVMGYFYKKKLTMGVLVGGSLAYTFSIIVSYIGSIVFLNIDFIQDSIELFKDSIKQSKAILQSFDASGQVNQQFEQLEEGMGYITTLIPTLFVTTGMVFAVITHLISVPILKRLRFELAPLKPFREWRLPTSIIWYYLISSILLMVKLDQDSFLFMAVLNLYFILQFFVLMQGYSFVFFYSYVKGWAKAIPIVILIASLIIPIFLYLIRILGIIDLGFPLRRKILKK
ncbi:YybS family protein [Metabacillus litoralis]|uniref:YybS family protein n=1 Tax=Metabacillus litoralis TaxID=152268 RepID=UPI0013CE90E3|nr:YybS family protein [Metabacillus litoralis]